MSNLMSELQIGNRDGVTEVTRIPVNAEDVSTSRPNMTRYSEVDGSHTLTVGPDHPLYGNTTPMSYNAAQDPDANPAEGLVTKHGNVQGDLTNDKSLLRINGMELDMPTAMKHGLIQKTSVGYILTDKAQDIMSQNNETNVQNAKAYQAQNVHVADTRARSAGLTKLEQAVGGAAVHSLITTTLSAGADGIPLRDRSAIESAAKASGMSVDQVLNTFNNAWQGSEIRAKAALSNAGYDAEGAMAHLWNTVEPKTRNSIVAGLVVGDASALNHLVKLYQTGDKR
ncbi:hypothetical protein [uncultured Desulfosarcina sp.]|uniref:hypothetical protein n=1 Tax=uncultured Desulfosarcina sp. TaxID=218289 RepID=UPI0029C7FDAB|nr:hypothetical protein [uncultured Desulfosarcina sp.]